MSAIIHPDSTAAADLAELARQLRERRRQEPDTLPPGFERAVDLREAHLGSGLMRYAFVPGTADPETALMSYRHMRTNYPAILALLSQMLSRGLVEVTIDVTPEAPVTFPTLSEHAAMRITSRVLALFRGSIDPLGYPLIPS